MLVLAVLLMSLKALLEPLILHCLGVCGVLKPYEPNNHHSAKKKRCEITTAVGMDQYTKRCAVPYTGEMVRVEWSDSAMT